MGTVTATIFVGTAHTFHGGIIPTHLILLTENDRPALILKSLDEKEEEKIIIPTLENAADDVFLMIAVYVLKKIKPNKELDRKGTLYEVFTDKERLDLYKQVKKAIKDTDLKVVFNILSDGSLIDIKQIKNYPVEYEITMPVETRKRNPWNPWDD
jgi:hypothetical protein